MKWKVFGNLVLDETVVLVSGNALRLTDFERKVLNALIQRAPAVCPRSDLYAALYGTSEPPKSNVLQVVVSRLRQKLDRAGANVDVHAQARQGYSLRMRPPATEAAQADAA